MWSDIQGGAEASQSYRDAFVLELFYSGGEVTLESIWWKRLQEVIATDHDDGERRELSTEDKVSFLEKLAARITRGPSVPHAVFVSIFHEQLLELSRVGVFNWESVTRREGVAHRDDEGVLFTVTQCWRSSILSRTSEEQRCHER